jgi:hypothetical protein
MSYRPRCFGKIHLHVAGFGLRHPRLHTAKTCHQQQNGNNSLLIIHASLLESIPVLSKTSLL